MYIQNRLINSIFKNYRDLQLLHSFKVNDFVTAYFADTKRFKTFEFEIIID